jgi:hypothetical protein
MNEYYYRKPVFNDQFPKLPSLPSTGHRYGFLAGAEMDYACLLRWIPSESGYRSQINGRARLPHYGIEGRAFYPLTFL